MVDEVENILREIANQVRAEQVLTTSSRTNGDSSSDSGVETQSSIKASLERLDAHMTTTARAWDRLPPVVSNRSGAIARVELWIKSFFKKTTNWYSWEQMNFNAAVHHSLREILSALSNLEAELQNARRQFVTDLATGLANETDSLTKRADGDRKALELQIESRAKEHEQKHEQQQEEQQQQKQQQEHQQQHQKELRAQLELQANYIAAQRVQFEELAAQLSELSTELRERSENLLQEQRVNFRQLSLEMSELATFVDRKRREIETRLGKNAKQRT